VAKAVSELPPRRKEVFELCFMEGLTYREVAEVLEISPKTVENQMGHALKSVRAFVDSRK
jgi:RNA polymerase sigma-70 factor (ECF subfamily)